MKYFVLKDSTEISVKINEENFERCTKNKEPYKQMTKDGVRYYATCPECENPIQLRGLYTSERVYGAHTGKDISGLNPFVYENYINCPLSAQGTTCPKDRRKSIETEKDKRIYNTLREYFDKAIQFAEIKFGFKINNKLAKDMLDVYYASRSWLYPHSTVNNLPFMLLYLYVAINPYGMWIRRGSALEKAIKRVNKLCLKEISTVNTNTDTSTDTNADKRHLDKFVSLGTTKYTKLNFMVWKHKFTELEDGSLLETINIQISENIANGDVPKWVDLVNLKIEIPEGEFVRFINSPKSLQYRNEELREYAKAVMPELVIK